MKFGIILPIWRLNVREAERLTLRAEELGWDAAFIPDHVVAMPATVQHYGPSWPEPCGMLAYLAGRTSRIRLGTSIIVLPYRGPLAQAKAVATVDQVSGGRFICGVGVGWDEEEFKALGIAFNERGRMADEYLRIWKTVWTQEASSFSGRYLSFENVGFAPRPVQQPHPPIWVAGSPFTLTRASVRRTAQLGDAWHPLGLSRDDMARGLALLREEAGRAGRSAVPSFCPRNLLNLSDEAKGADRALFEGSPDQVAADVRYVQGLGAEYITFDLYACPDVPSMERMIERFVKDVQPAIA